jgi:hypothetical protein
MEKNKIPMERPPSEGDGLLVRVFPYLWIAFMVWGTIMIFV